MAPSSLQAHRAECSALRQEVWPRKPARGPQSSRRPLYLCAPAKARVDADGAALRVRSTGRADARYPLYRVSRVIANLRVDWSAAALQACLETGIPIVMVAGNGAPLGSFQPASVRPSRVAEDLDELLARPDGREAYVTWLRAVRMQVLGEWRTRREMADKPLAAGVFKEMVRRHVYGMADTISFDEAAGLWRGALCALAAGALHRAALQPVFWSSGGAPVNLLDDMTRLLDLRLRLEVQSGMEHSLVGDGVVLRVFHALSDSLEKQCERVLSGLARHVKQGLAQWR